ncbi:hypothetical protein pb186bvf_008680 [Paramecium bursaria]
MTENQFFDILKQIIAVDENIDESFYKRVAKKVQSLINNKSQLKIIEQLSYANLESEINDKNDKHVQTMNVIFFSSSILTSFLFRKYIWRVGFLLSTAYANFSILQPIQMEYRLRKLAKENTITGQEIRNLYRFYFKDSSFVREMDQQCSQFLLAQEIKKDIYKRKA